MYTRLPADTAKTDPFTGLYLGSFSPHGPEIIQLRRSLTEVRARPAYWHARLHPCRLGGAELRPSWDIMYAGCSHAGWPAHVKPLTVTAFLRGGYVEQQLCLLACPCENVSLFFSSLQRHASPSEVAEL